MRSSTDDNSPSVGATGGKLGIVAHGVASLQSVAAKAYCTLVLEFEEMLSRRRENQNMRWEAAGGAGAPERPPRYRRGTLKRF